MLENEFGVQEGFIMEGKLLDKLKSILKRILSFLCDWSCDWSIVIIVSVVVLIALWVVWPANRCDYQEFNVVLQVGMSAFATIFIGILTRNFYKRQEVIRKEHEYKQEIIATKATAITHLANEQPGIVAAAITEIIDLIQQCNDLKKKMPTETEEMNRIMQELVNLAYKTNLKKNLKYNPSVISAKAKGLNRISEKDMNQDDPLHQYDVNAPMTTKERFDPYLNFDEADLHQTIIRRTSLQGIKMNDVNWENSELSNVNLSSAAINNVNFVAAKMCQVKFNGTFMQNANLSHATINTGWFKNAYLDWVTADAKTSMTNVDLTEAHVTKAKIIASNLRGAKCTNADFTDAILTGAKLQGAYLKGAKLIRTNLCQVNLTDADLTDVDLTDADLTDADLTDTKLTHVKLADAAKLTGIRCRIEEHHEKQ